MRRKKHEEHINHEAWAIPYADLMTLLLAFFVVMYAVSVVNEGKYRVASESMLEAFNGSPARLPLAPGQASPVSPGNPSAAIIAPLAPRRAAAPAVVTQDSAPINLLSIETQVRKALQPLIDKHLVRVRRGRDQLEIEIRTDILFPSGVAQLSLSADGVLRKLAVILAPFDNPLRVEGFTDDVPIATAMYPSDWELSAARAATVARLFAGSGVDPARLGIVGWGDVRPLADNATSEGRNQNRRVLVVVMGGPDPAQRPTQDIDALGTAPELAAQPAPASPLAAAALIAAPPGAEVAPPDVARERARPAQ